MKSLKVLGVFLITSLMLFSCGKNNADVDGNLAGSFDVTKVEGQRYFNGNADIYLVDNNPTGYIKFNSNGTGKQDYTFTLYGNSSRQYSNFSWSATSSKINVDRVNEPDLVWDRLVNEKNKQIAAYDIIVDANTTIKYTLTMEK